MSLLGTGTLLKIADTRLLVTAAHVAHVAAKKKVGLFVPGVKTKFVSLKGRVISAPQSKVDVSILELHKDAVARLEGKRFLTLADLYTNAGPPSQGWYYIHGYPSSYAPADVLAPGAQVVALSYGSVLYEGPTDTFDSESYDQNMHILFQMYKDRNYSFDGNEEPVPKIHGVSGCSIWHVADFDVDRDRWMPDMAKVVAVETGFFSRRYPSAQGDLLDVMAVKGVRWWVLMHMLWKQFPELKPAIRVHFPLME
jgi:hypothetical protein